MTSRLEFITTQYYYKSIQTETSGSDDETSTQCYRHINLIPHYNMNEKAD